MKRNGHYWTDDDKSALLVASSFSDLAPIALAVLRRMSKPVGAVCGPISTGGLGNKVANLAVFDATIEYLIQRGMTVFDQIPFEDHFFRMVDTGWGTRENNQLLNEFYLPIFESGHVSRLFFIHGWESSHGASWEHALAERRGMEIVYLEPNLVRV